MDRTQLCHKHLAQAERHVATSRRNVDQQRGIVVALARSDRATERAVRLLRQFEDLLDLHLQDRDRLRAELAYEKVKPS
jgi:uncharacterized protein (DUF952 family)